MLAGAPGASLSDAVVRRLVEIILGEDLKNASERLAPGAPASIYDEVAEWIDLVVTSAPGTRTVALNLPADQRALAIAYFGSEEPVRYLESFEPESVCREGLAWLGEESQRRIAKGFLDVDAGGQAELVRAISDARPDRSATHAGTRLFHFLKEETIRAFYTSRMGLKELDDHGNSFYGQPPGCGLPLRFRPTFPIRLEWLVGLPHDRHVATNVQEAVVAGSGHWLMEERPAETVALIRTFLDAASSK